MTYVGGLLHLPIHRKALNFLTWDIWFSLIKKKKKTFDIQPSCSLFQNLYVTWLSLLSPIVKEGLSGLLEMLSLRLKS